MLGCVTWGVLRRDRGRAPQCCRMEFWRTTEGESCRQQQIPEPTVTAPALDPTRRLTCPCSYPIVDDLPRRNAGDRLFVSRSIGLLVIVGFQHELFVWDNLELEHSVHVGGQIYG